MREPLIALGRQDKQLYLRGIPLKFSLSIPALGVINYYEIKPHPSTIPTIAASRIYSVSLFKSYSMGVLMGLWRLTSTPPRAKIVDYLVAAN